jgi:hypothetical protein
MKRTPVQQAKDHQCEAAAKREGAYQLVMHTDTLVAILNGTPTGDKHPGVFDRITEADLPIAVLKLHGASICLDDRVLVGAVNRRPC